MTYRLNYLIFALACATGICVRTVMLLFTIEEKSGFIISEYAVWAIVLLVFLVLAAAIIFSLSLIEKPKNIRSCMDQGIIFPISCIAVAIAIIYETFFSGIMSGAVLYQTLIHSILAIVSAVALLLIAYCGFMKLTFPPIISVIPIFFWITRLIIIFSSFSTISVISDTIIETAAMCLTLITFIIYAKLESGYLEKEKHLLAFATVLVNTYVCLIASVPRIICDITSFEQAVHLHPVPSLTTLSAALFSIIVSARLTKAEK